MPPEPSSTSVSCSPCMDLTGKRHNEAMEPTRVLSMSLQSIRRVEARDLRVERALLRLRFVCLWILVVATFGFLSAQVAGGSPAREERPAASPPLRVLFIGNSLTAANDL